MHSLERPTTPRILIVGGGAAALEAMLAVRTLAAGRATVGLVAPQRDFVYRPLAISEPFGIGRVHRFDLATLAARAGVELTPTKVAGVDPERHHVLSDDGSALSYDALLIASGARLRPALAGAITFWGIADAADIDRLLAELERGAAQRVAFAAHTGVGWPLPAYELALLTDWRLRRAGVEGRGLVLVTHEAEPLEMLGRKASRRVRDLLEARGIDLLVSCRATGVREGVLDTVPQGAVPADRVLTLPRLEGPGLAGLPADEHGFIPVDGFGRLPGIADVYAAGEVTTFPIRQGGLATQQAHAAATAIAAAVGAPVDPGPFRPVLRGLLGTGAPRALVRAALQPQEPPSCGAATAVEVELSAAAA